MKSKIEIQRIVSKMNNKNESRNGMSGVTQILVNQKE